jgi:hypothetical protein
MYLSHKHTVSFLLRGFTQQAAWNCYDNQKNTSESFSKAEQESWNAQKKKQQQDASTSAGSSSK